MALSAAAQKQCGTEAYQTRIRKEDPSAIRIQGAHINSLSAAGSSSASAGPAPQQQITIPVVVHVLYKNLADVPDAVIRKQLEILNRDFNLANDDAEKIPAAFSPFAGVSNIRFELARTDPDGRATTGINRKRSAREFWANDDKVKDPAYGGVKPWDSRSYLNIWVCNLVPGLLGYSSAPGSSPDKDGVVIQAGVFGGGSGSFSMGRTAVHEIGHWMNLKHLWGESECGSDEVDDTPPQRKYNQGCPSFPKLNPTCGDGNAAGEMFMNFMDFTDDACMLMFTRGQVSRMREMFAMGGMRESIMYSRALGEPWNKGDGNIVVTTSSVETQAAATVRVSIYPNPTASTITFNAKGASLPGKRYTLFSVDGRQIQEGILSSENMNINVSSLKPGVYFVKLTGIEQALRFIKQ